MEVCSCRACLSNGEDLIPIDETFVNGYNLLTSLNIMLSDGLSQYACQNCTNAVKFYLFFRERSITSESTLQQRLLQEIKSESEVKNDFLIEETNLVTLSVPVPVPVPKLKIMKRKGNKRNTKHGATISQSDSNPHRVHISSVFNHLDGNGNSTQNADVKIKQEVETDQFDTVFENGFENSIQLEDIQFLVKNEEMDVHDIKPRKSKRNKRKTCVNYPDITPRKLKTKKQQKSLETTEDLQQFSCGLCTKTFMEQAALSEHLEAHKRDGRCGVCGEEFDRWPTLLAHRMAHVHKSQHRCHVCDKFCGYVTMMEFHYMTAHYDGQKPEFPCKLCARSYPTPRKLRKHVWGAHTVHGSFVCDYCSKNFHNKQRLKSHIKSHIEERSYVCDTCGFACKRSSGLRDHVTRKHCPRKALCAPCQRVFPSPEARARHACPRTSAVCPVCGLTIERTSYMSRHMLKHRDVVHRCPRPSCPAQYKTRGGLKVHLDRHDGRRAHKCEHCARAFYSPSVLIKHRRVHTGEKPYVCKVCGKGFTGNHNLKVHMKVHGEHNLVVKRVKEPIPAAVLK